MSLLFKITSILLIVVGGISLMLFGFAILIMSGDPSGLSLNLFDFIEIVLACLMLTCGILGLKGDYEKVEKFGKYFLWVALATLVGGLLFWGVSVMRILMTIVVGLFVSSAETQRRRRHTTHQEDTPNKYMFSQYPPQSANTSDNESFQPLSRSAGRYQNPPQPANTYTGQPQTAGAYAPFQPPRQPANTYTQQQTPSQPSMNQTLSADTDFFDDKQYSQPPVSFSSTDNGFMPIFGNTPDKSSNYNNPAVVQNNFPKGINSGSVAGELSFEEFEKMLNGS